jgi:hypothetical protein
LKVNEVAVHRGGTGNDHPDEVAVYKSTRLPRKVVKAARLVSITPNFCDDERKAEEG